MSQSTGQLLCIEEFSQLTFRSAREIIRSLEAGKLSGKKIENEWYVDASQIGSGAVYCKSEADALVRAAAALDWRKILAPLNARREAVFKAPTVELGISITDIRVEAERAQQRAMLFDWIIGIAALIGIFAAIDIWATPSYDEIYYLSDEASSSSIQILLAAYSASVVAIFIHTRLSKRRARAILAANAAERSYDANYCAKDEPNVVVSGGFSPFVGAGEGAGGWSFTMNLAEAADVNSPVLAATPDALYQEAESALCTLGMPDLVIRDEIYVDGRDVRDVPQLMPMGSFNAPLETLSAGHIGQHIGSDDRQTRHYKAIRFVLWSSQIVLSTFLRYVVVKNVLYVEARSFVLPPLAARFLALKNLPLVPQFSERITDFVLSFLRAIYAWVPVLLRAFNFVQGGFLDTKSRWLKRSKKEVLANQRYNYGWDKSLRETWAGRDYERYFQMVDLDFCQKVVRESLLNSLLKSLEARNICTESLKNASTVIHNEGVIVNGGQLKAENLTAGRSAQATVQHITTRSPRPGKE